MCPKPLDVTRTSLATCCTSLCNSSSCNPYNLSKGLLVKYWWCLTSTPWMTSTSSPAISHLHMSNDKLNSNAVSLRRKHSLETLFTYRKIFHTLCPCIHRYCKRIIQDIKSYLTKNFILFISFYFKNILFYFIFFENLVNSAHEQCPKQ